MRLPLFLGLSALAAAAAVPAAGQNTSPAEPKVNQLVVYGSDPCPRSTDDEITVCARRPESDRYRIPENLRGDPTAPHNESWATRAEDLEYVGRTGIGSCTPVGPGGGTGCFEKLVREARLERENGDDVSWKQLVEDARRERLGQIDAKSEAVERQLKAEEQAAPR